MPEEPLVVRSNNKIVPAGMYIERGNPSSAGLDDFDKFLARKIVTANHALCCDKEDWLGWMKVGTLHFAF